MIYDGAIDRLGKRWLRASLIQLHKWIQMGINFSVSAIKDSFDLRLDLLLARDSVDCCSLLLSTSPVYILLLSSSTECVL